MVDATDLKSVSFGSEGSSPSVRTIDPHTMFRSVRTSRRCCRRSRPAGGRCPRRGRGDAGDHLADGQGGGAFGGGKLSGQTGFEALDLGAVALDERGVQSDASVRDGMRATLMRKPRSSAVSSLARASILASSPMPRTR